MTQNIKQKAIEAMDAVRMELQGQTWDAEIIETMLDAVLAVLADPENHPDYKHDIKVRDFCARLNHVKGLPT